eukprot:g12324.t1
MSTRVTVPLSSSEEQSGEGAPAPIIKALAAGTQTQTQTSIKKTQARVASSVSSKGSAPARLPESGSNPNAKSNTSVIPPAIDLSLSKPNDAVHIFFRWIPLLITLTMTLSLWTFLVVGYAFQDQLSRTVFLVQYCFFSVLFSGWLASCAVWALIGTVRMRRESTVDWTFELEDYLAQHEQLANGLLHFVILPFYKEPEDLLTETIQNMTCASHFLAREYLVLVLAVEDRAGAEDLAKANSLKRKFRHMFLDIVVNVHRANELPREVAGKSSNVQSAFLGVTRYLSDHFVSKEQQKQKEALGGAGAAAAPGTSAAPGGATTASGGNKRMYDESKTFVTILDADTLLHRQFFPRLTYKGLVEQSAEQRRWSIYQAPQLEYRNSERVHGPIRAQSHGHPIYETGGIASSSHCNHCSHACYTMTLSLLLSDNVRGWDADVIAEDQHMFIKCLASSYWRNLEENGGQRLTIPQSELRLVPLYTPALSYSVHDPDFRTAMAMKFTQSRRHLQAVSEISYLALQWFRLSKACKQGLPLRVHLQFLRLMGTIAAPMCMIPIFGFFGALFGVTNLFSHLIYTWSADDGVIVAKHVLRAVKARELLEHFHEVPLFFVATGVILPGLVTILVSHVAGVILRDVMEGRYHPLHLMDRPTAYDDMSDDEDEFFEEMRRERRQRKKKTNAGAAGKPGKNKTARPSREVVLANQANELGSDAGEMTSSSRSDTVEGGTSSSERATSVTSDEGESHSETGDEDEEQLLTSSDRDEDDETEAEGDSLVVPVREQESSRRTIPGNGNRRLRRSAFGRPERLPRLPPLRMEDRDPREVDSCLRPRYNHKYYAILNYDADGILLAEKQVGEANFWKRPLTDYIVYQMTDWETLTQASLTESDLPLPHSNGQPHRNAAGGPAKTESGDTGAAPQQHSPSTSRSVVSLGASTSSGSSGSALLDADAEVDGADRVIPLTDANLQALQQQTSGRVNRMRINQLDQSAGQLQLPGPPEQLPGPTALPRTGMPRCEMVLFAREMDLLSSLWLVVQCFLDFATWGLFNSVYLGMIPVHMALWHNAVRGNEFEYVVAEKPSGAHQQDDGSSYPAGAAGPDELAAGYTGGPCSATVQKMVAARRKGAASTISGPSSSTTDPGDSSSLGGWSDTGACRESHDLLSSPRTRALRMLDSAAARGAKSLQH